MELVPLVLLPLLAFLAAFRGWGFWPFLLLAAPFLPDLVNMPGGGNLTLQGRLVSLPLWITIVGLALMIAMGRERGV